MAAPLLRRGYTVFAIYHVSQPEATVMEIVEDMHRAVGCADAHAADHGGIRIDWASPGGSAGGHLSLMLATVADRDRPTPRPQEQRGPSVAIFFPVTDLLDLGKSTENLGDGGPPKSFRRSFGRSGRQPGRLEKHRPRSSAESPT